MKTDILYPEKEFISTRKDRGVTPVQAHKQPERTQNKTVSDLWDSCTRTELNPAELERYAEAKKLLRAKHYMLAKDVLKTPLPENAEALNLLGVLHELCTEFDAARRCFGTASTRDKDCWAARMNARRIFELTSFGRSDIPMYL